MKQRMATIKGAMIAKAIWPGSAPGDDGGGNGGNGGSASGDSGGNGGKLNGGGEGAGLGLGLAARAPARRTDTATPKLPAFAARCIAAEVSTRKLMQHSYSGKA
jgi:hypothetical protein